MKNELTYIIDDDKLTVKLISILFSKSNISKKTLTFNDVQSAITKLKDNWSNNENLPDVILLDLNMPVMDGWQFLDEFILLPINKKISIFILTSSIDPVDIEKAKKYDVIKDYIIKPITPLKLAQLFS